MEVDGAKDPRSLLEISTIMEDLAATAGSWLSQHAFRTGYPEYLRRVADCDRSSLTVLMFERLPENWDAGHCLVTIGIGS